MVLTEEQIKEIVANTPKLERIKKPEPAAAPVSNVVLATERKLSVEGQRERVAREIAELGEAEKNRQACIETHRERQRRARADGLFYRAQYEALAQAEYWAKQLDTPARRGEYSPIARFEQQTRDEHGY
jgi:hypothetical protein